jgi:hypothetical protein
VRPTSYVLTVASFAVEPHPPLLDSQAGSLIRVLLAVDFPHLWPRRSLLGPSSPVFSSRQSLTCSTPRSHACRRLVVSCSPLRAHPAVARPLRLAELICLSSNSPHSISILPLRQHAKSLSREFASQHCCVLRPLCFGAAWSTSLLATLTSSLGEKNMRSIEKKADTHNSRQVFG